MKKLTIGGIVYKVKLVNNLKDNGEQVWGYVDYAKCIIYVRKNTSKQRINQTIIHEATHILLYECGLDNLSSEEKVVTPLGNALYMFLNENNNFIK